MFYSHFSCCSHNIYPIISLNKTNQSVFIMYMNYALLEVKTEFVYAILKLSAPCILLIFTTYNKQKHNIFNS